MASMLIFYGAVFIVVELIRRKKEPTITRTADLTFKAAVIIGCAQILALVPGTSRSGITIIAALLIGVSRSISAEFTFFVAIPVMLGASALKFFKYVFVDNIRMTGVQWIVLVVASAVAYAVSMLVIRAVMKFLKKHDFIPFGIYRIVFGVVIILVFALFFH